MLINHHKRAQSVSVRDTVTIIYVTGQALTPVRPIPGAGRAQLHQLDPIFTVPGTAIKGSTYSRSADFRLPASGRIVAGGGHLHGGGVRLDLADTTCGERLFQLLPTWGGVMPMPMMHEAGADAHVALREPQGDSPCPPATSCG